MPEDEDVPDTMICPHCRWELRKEDVAVVMFPRATVVACPKCKKTITLHTHEF